jgi:hypothetical protein
MEKMSTWYKSTKEPSSTKKLQKRT